MRATGEPIAARDEELEPAQIVHEVGGVVRAPVRVVGDRVSPDLVARRAFVVVDENEREAGYWIGQADVDGAREGSGGLEQRWILGGVVHRPVPAHR